MPLRSDCLLVAHIAGLIPNGPQGELIGILTEVGVSGGKLRWNTIELGFSEPQSLFLLSRAEGGSSM